MSENPYAPPTAPDAPPDSGLRPWTIEGGALLVRSGAILPRIDLITGTDRDIIPVVLKLKHLELGKPSTYTAKYYVSREIALRRSLIFRWLTLVVIAAVICMMILLTGTERHWSGRVAVPILAVFIVSAAFVVLLQKPRPVIRRKGVYQFKGTSPISLERLATLEPLIPPVHPTRMVLLRRVNYFRWPAPLFKTSSFLNPLTPIQLLLIRRARRNPNFIADIQDPSEYERLPLDPLPLRIVRLIAPWTGQPEPWQLISYRRAEMSNGPKVHEFLLLCSPDLRHLVCITLLTTASSAIAVTEQIHFVLLTLLQDGSSIRTSSAQLLPGPENMETYHHRVKAEPLRLHHLQHIGNRPVEPARSPSHWLERMEEQDAVCFALNVAAGYQDEPRMVECAAPIDPEKFLSNS